eukprot:gnl/TRDRNA2_/TRDRNA2_80078_c2_seq1.p1 gnl/TRDRNA2_/TRDRNA2_80078_c2~~gnl/TRDRNA2_/TRDRNA2_80078_c2_seq1.p1  ORF type:complete len:450 (-),score=68.78 gnl/TRDRNA2_/TRDRNA2_80078_c2_seq1:80-1330(-)
MESITSAHKAFLLVVAIIRLVIVCTLCIGGSYWLAYTKHIPDLILNSSALAYILDTDETIFDILMPAEIQVLLGKMKPLEKDKSLLQAAGDVADLAKATKGITLSPKSTVPVIICILYVSLFQALLILPGQTDMQGIREAMCGGYTEFVFGINGDSGMAAVAKSKPIEAMDAGSVYMLAVEEGTKSGGNGELLRRNTRADHTTSMFALQAHFSEDMQETAIHWHTCEDTNFTRPESNQVRETLLAITGVSATSCGDLRERCDAVELPVLRLHCPVTCGCDQPRSGQFFGNAAGGCAKVCSEGRTWLTDLADRPCIDLQPEESDRWKSWERWLDTLLAFSQVWASKEEKWSDSVKAAKEKGCAVLKDDPQMIRYCDADGNSGSSLRAFCPESCSCSDLPTGSPLCPSSCWDSMRPDL